MQTRLFAFSPWWARFYEEVGAKEPYKILLIGGGYMVTQVGNRDATKDIDCIFTSASLTSPVHTLFAQSGGNSP